MNVVAIPIIESNTELQGTRHNSMTARGVGGTTDRNSLSARQANGAAMNMGRGKAKGGGSSRYLWLGARAPLFIAD